MSNLPGLIRLSNQLAEMTMSDVQQDSNSRAELILHKADNTHTGLSDSFRLRLIEKNQLIQDAFSAYEKELTELKQEVNRLINEGGTEWLQRSYIWYEKQLADKSAQSEHAPTFHKNKPTRIKPEVETMLKNRIASQCTWQHPAVIFHPMLEPFIHDMVSADPLYVVDESHYLLEPTIAQFNKEYKNRVRTYVIEESFDEPLLPRLPDNQIGFCVAYNYFNYKPFEIIKKYIEELYQKLLPGATLAFTFNDCDRYRAMQSVEQNTTCYTPGTLVRAWAKYVGFEETFFYADNEEWSWVEFQKPGELTTLRGGQSLAKIMPKPIANSK